MEQINENKNARQKAGYLVNRFAIAFYMAFAIGVASVVFLWINTALFESGCAVCIILTILLVMLFVFFRFRIYAPYKETERMLRVFSKGYSMQGANSLKWRLTPATEEIIKKLEGVLLSDAAVSLSKKQAQFLAMQNQINPHFLYNTLEGIRGEALSEGNESIAKMTETLSQFFRYTISNLENLVTLDDELVNVRNSIRYKDTVLAIV